MDGHHTPGTAINFYFDVIVASGVRSHTFYLKGTAWPDFLLPGPLPSAKGITFVLTLFIFKAPNYVLARTLNNVFFLSIFSFWPPARQLSV